MKRIIITALCLWTIAHAQPKVLLEGAGRATRDSFSVVGSRNIVMWGNSLTEAGRFEMQFMRRSNRYVHNGGVSGETSTQIRARMVADTLKQGWGAIFEVGRNNINQRATILADVAAMVAQLGHQRYIIFSVINARDEPTGTAGYDSVAAINADLASAYGAHYVDVRSYLISQYNPSIPQDVTDHGNDVPPSSKMTDLLHPNTAGDTLIANYVYENKFYLFNFTDSGVVSSKSFTKGVDNNNLYTQNIFFDRRESTKDYITTNSGEYVVGNIAFIRMTWALNQFKQGYRTGLAATGTHVYLMGYQAGQNLTTGADNSAYGGLNFGNATTASNLAAFGKSALEQTTGAGNTGIGAYAGRGNITGTGNLWVGYNAGNVASQISNGNGQTIVGVSAYGLRSNQAVFGALGTTETQLQGRVGVNLSHVAPKTNAQLQINSLVAGFMPPRMTAAQRLAISVTSGDSSLVVWDTDSSRLFIYTGAAWRGLRYTSDAPADPAPGVSPSTASSIPMTAQNRQTVTYIQTANSSTYTLPSIMQGGTTFVIVNGTSANTVTVQSGSSNIIVSGAATNNFAVNAGLTRSVVSDGTNWYLKQF